MKWRDEVVLGGEKMRTVKTIIPLALCSLVLLVIMGIVMSKINVEDDMNNRGTILINNVEISSRDTIIYENEVFIPFQAVLEAIGSTVVYDQDTGNIYFDYAGEEYVCAFKASSNSHFPEKASILISTVENRNSRLNVNYIQLHPMGAAEFSRVIDNEVYLYQQTGQRLFEALGYNVVIDVEQRRMSLYKY